MCSGRDFPESKSKGEKTLIGQVLLPLVALDSHQAEWVQTPMSWTCPNDICLFVCLLIYSSHTIHSEHNIPSVCSSHPPRPEVYRSSIFLLKRENLPGISNDALSLGTSLHTNYTIEHRIKSFLCLLSVFLPIHLKFSTETDIQPSSKKWQTRHIRL